VKAHTFLTCLLLFAFCLLPFAFSAQPAGLPQSHGRLEVLSSVDALPADLMGRFREPAGCERISGGPTYVFDRRGHSVHTITPDDRTVRTLVEIGGEPGRLLEPSAFDVAPDGSFAVADAPGGRERIQVFGPAGLRIGGFTRAGRTAARVAIGSLVLSGVGSLIYTGATVILSEPDTGWLLTEYSPLGAPIRSMGRLRATGHEDDRELHLALNAGLALPDADGGFFFVFLSGTPAFRRYSAAGELIFERMIQGRELDPIVAALPQRWPARTVDAREAPLVPPIIRTAAVDPQGRLWVSFVLPVTYVFDADGEKLRTVQFRAAGLVAPSSLSFPAPNRLLITPGCYEFTF
jgi:hypothetical protein